MANDTVLLWGILGCGEISHDFTLAVTRIHSPRHKFVAAASRSSIDSSEKFAKRFGIPKFYGSYEELLADPEINVVYVGNLHRDHMSVALAAIDAGKGVLVEKPMTMTANDTKRILEASRTKGVLVMEGLWSRFNPAYRRIQQLLSEQKPAAVMVNFTTNAERVARIVRPELGGGVMLDMGIYAVQFATFVFGGAAPTTVLASGHLNEFGVDAAASVSLRYASGGHASLLVDMRCGASFLNEARIFLHSDGGDFTSIRICAPFYMPDRLELTKKDGSVVVENYPIFPNQKPDDGLKFYHSRSPGLAFEAEGFADAFEKWKASSTAIEHPFRTHSDSIIDAEIIDKVTAQIRKCAAIHD